MSDGININVGTEGSSLDRNQITIGDTAGGNIEKRLSEHFHERLKDLENEVKTIKSFLAGSSLGEPGLTARVTEALTKIRAMEKDLDLLDVIDERLDRHEGVLKDVSTMLSDYRPMLEEMRLTYRTKTPVPVYVFYAVLFLLALSVAVTYLVVYLGRGA